MSRQKMSLADAMVKSLTGRRAKKTTTTHRLRDIAKAFKDEPWRAIGVSKKTWQSWQSGKRKPSKASLGKIESAWATPQVRTAQLGRRAKQLTQGGMTFKAFGKMGPGADEDYWRVRSVTAELDSATAANVMDAYILGGPESAAEELKHALAENYFGVTGPWTAADTCGLVDLERVQFRPGTSQSAMSAKEWLAD